MPDQKVIAPGTVQAWERYRIAKLAKSQWTAEEKDAKEALMGELGYDPDDPKPTPCDAVTEPGQVLFHVKVGDRRSLDTRLLRKVHPDVYAECEKTTHPISIQEVT